MTVDNEGISFGNEFNQSPKATPKLSIFHFQLSGTSKNSPFAIWVDLLFQQFISKSSQYTKYSGLSETFVKPKSLTQIIKKEFLEVACQLILKLFTVFHMAGVDDGRFGVFDFPIDGLFFFLLYAYSLLCTNSVCRGAAIMPDG